MQNACQSFWQSLLYFPLVGNIIQYQLRGLFHADRRIHDQFIVSGIAPAFAGDVPVIGRSCLVGAADIAFSSTQILLKEARLIFVPS